MTLRIALFCLSALILSGCVGLPETGSWRYKLTVNVDTPEGMKSGSAVRQVNVYNNTDNYNLIVGMRGGCGFKVKGEAVVVDLGQRGKVFVVLQSDDNWQMVFHTLPMPTPGGQCLSHGIEYYENLKAKAESPLHAHPMMVTFSDLNDPMSVKYVYGIEQKKDAQGRSIGGNFDKQVKEDNFAALFGEGVKLHSITIEMTDDKVTEEIEEVLPWLPEYRNKLFDGRNIHTIEAENRLANSLGLGSFAIGTISEPVLKKMFAPPKSHVQQP